MSSDPSVYLEQIDTWIRQGNFQEAIAAIEDIEVSVRQWKLEDTLAFANLCRRAGLPLVSLKALRPWIFLDAVLRPDAPDAAKSSYGAALINIGANSEAESFFSGLPEEKFPEVLLHASFGYFREWNYKKSIPLLRRYTQHPALSEYQRLVGKVNLIAALIFVGDSTEKIMKSSMTLAQKMNATLLYSNLLELQAQDAIVKGQKDQAIQALNQASQFLHQGSSAYQLHLQKWTWFLKAQSKQESIEKLFEERARIQQKALRLNHRETLRDMDLYWGHFTEDESLIHKVWFGSPYKHYRDRIQKLTGKDFSFLEKQIYLWTPDPLEDDQKVRVQTPLDLNAQESGLSAQGITILRILSMDFYRPVRIGELFSQLYPNEHFDPHHSVDRLKKGLHRARLHLQELGLDLHIQWKKSEIQLVGSSCLKIQLSSQDLKNNSLHEDRQWFSKLEGKVFSKKDLSEITGWTESTLNRKIESWLEKKWILELQDQHQIRKKYYILASEDLRKIPERFKKPKWNKKAS